MRPRMVEHPGGEPGGYETQGWLSIQEGNQEVMRPRMVEHPEGHTELPNLSVTSQWQCGTFEISPVCAKL